MVDKMENDGLKWERTVSYNVGVDFFRIVSEVLLIYIPKDWLTKDLLIQRDLPPSTGYKSMTINQGSLRNKGLEVSLHGDIRTKDFTWSLSGNIAFNRPEILDFGLPEEEWEPDKIGRPIWETVWVITSVKRIYLLPEKPRFVLWLSDDGIIQENDPYINR